MVKGVFRRRPPVLFMRSAFAALLCLLMPPSGMTVQSDIPPPPKRVLIEPPPRFYRVRHARVGATHARGIVLKLYFEDKLNQCHSLRFVSPSRATAVLGELAAMGEGLRHDAKADAANRMLPVDAIVRFPDREDPPPYARVKLPGRVMELPPGEPGESILSLVQRTAHLLADALELPDHERALLLDIGFPNDEVVYAYYGMMYGGSRNMAAVGHMSLNYLRPLWSKYRNDSQLGAQILRAAHRHVRSLGDTSDFTPTALQMALEGLPSVLGTPYEIEANGIVALRPGVFSELLTALARPVTRRVDDLSDLLDDLLEDVAAPAGDPLLPGMATASDAFDLGIDLTDDVRLGALRLCGLLPAADALEIILAGARHPSVTVRRAAVTALGRMQHPRTTGALQALLNDPDEETAFRAAHALAERDQAPSGLLQSAVALVSSDNSELRRLAVDTAAKGAETLPRDLLTAWRDSGRSDLEEIAIPLLMQASPDVSRIPDLLQDPRIMMVVTALDVVEAMAGPLPREWLPLLIRMANEPYQALADRARRLLDANRPGDPLIASAFDLQYEHSYRRRRLLQSFAASQELPWRELLFEGVRNLDPHIRALTLDLLAGQGDARIHEAILQLLDDPHTWVRVVAAYHAGQWMKPADQPALETALQLETDPVVKLYLGDAMAAIGAAEPPDARPAARRVAEQPNLTWLREMGEDVAESPFQAYYCPGPPVTELWRQAAGAGKIVFVRYSTVWAPNPGRFLTEPRMRDGMMQTLYRLVDHETLPWTDGMVFDESWSFPEPQELWGNGWRFFCLESAIDPDTVNGDRDLLTPMQQYQWNQWAMERITEGFNWRSDFVRRYFGRLRPGLQIGTFLAGGFNNYLGRPARAMDFDVSMTYGVSADNRMAIYAPIRRAKTLWPDRPVVWMGDGIGNREANPLRRTDRVPDRPFIDRANRAYADVVSGWIAGADPGWSSAWTLIAPAQGDSLPQLPDLTINIEDIQPDGSKLQAAMAHLFQGVAAALLTEDVPQAPGADPVGVMLAARTQNLSDDLDLLGEVGSNQRRREVEQQILEQQAVFRRGFLSYRRFVYDCARVFAGLPRLHPQPAALVVRRHARIGTVPATPHPLVPAEALLNEFDFANDINLLADLDLSRYRLIILHDPGIVESASMTAVSEWLRTVPGLLYLHRAPPLPLEPDDPVARRWPWNVSPALQRKPEESRGLQLDVKLSGKGRSHTLQAALGGGLTPGSNPSQVLWRDADGGVTTALWRDPAARGVVLTDGVESADSIYLSLLRDALNVLSSDHGIGLALEGPILQVRGEGNGVVAAAVSGAYADAAQPTAMTGIELFSGESDPMIGNGVSGALVARGPDRYDGYSAAGAGLVALADRPFSRAETRDNSMVLQSDSIFRIAGGENLIRVTRLDGGRLPEIQDDPETWVESGQTDGQWVRTFVDRRGSLVFVRSTGPVRAAVVRD